MKSVGNFRKFAFGASAAALLLAASNVQAPAQNQAQQVATLGDWIVEFVPGQRQRNIPAYCQATKVFDQEVMLRMVSGANIYAIDFKGVNSMKGDPRSYDLAYFFDQPNQNMPPRHAVAPLIKDNEGMEWFRIEEPINEPGSSDEMMRARVITIQPTNLNDRQWQYQLDGSGQALNALFDCRDEKVLGQPRQQRAPAPVAQMPAPTQQFIQPAQQFFAAAAPQFRQAPPPPMPQFQGAPPPPPPSAQFRQGPPQQMAQVQPVRQVNPAYCNEYGNQMAGWTKQALAARCQGWPQGHLNASGHATWCMKQPFAAVERAKETWGAKLDGCVINKPGGPPPAPLPAAGRNPQFSVEWVQVGGKFRVAATRAGPPNSPLCVHGIKCTCPGAGTYCGQHRNGTEVEFWKDGCNRPAITIKCVIQQRP